MSKLSTAEIAQAMENYLLNRGNKVSTENVTEVKKVEVQKPSSPHVSKDSLDTQSPR